MPLPAALRRRYGGDLDFPARPVPYVFANFVSSVDGVVSYGVPGRSGGGTLSGGDAADRFLMALLRAAADAVIVGATTLREAGARALWSPGFTCPEAAADLARWRRARRVPPSPLLVVLTTSGRLNPRSAVFTTPGSRVLVISSKAGAAALAPGLRGASAEVEVRPWRSPAGRVPVPAMLRLLRREYKIQRLLHEGGPALLGEFLAAGAIQQLFLTLAPRLAGRSRAAPRPGLVEGVAFAAAASPQLRLVSLKAHGAMLFTRYRVTDRDCRSGG
ncbi:MAG: RibD family protein [Terriglobales bacterium]